MSVLVVGPPILLWVAVVARSRRLSDPLQRALWWALLLCAVASTLNVPAVAAVVDLEEAPANISQLLKHCLVVAAAWQSFEVVRGLTAGMAVASSGRTARGYAAGLVVLLLVALFLASPADDATANFTATYSDEPLIGAYWMVFLLALGVVLGSIGRLAWWYRQSTPPGGLRTGMTLVSIGVAAGLLYVVLKVAYVVARLVGTPDQVFAGAERTLTPALLAASIVTIVVGLTWPALSERWPVRHIRAAYHYALLRGLWLEVTAAVPEVSLERVLAEGETHEGSRHLAGRHETELLLFRRLVEILDGMLVLDHYVTPAEAAAVRRHVARTVPERQRAAVEERALLELGIAAHAAGNAATALRRRHASADLTPLQEVHRLRAMEVARGAARPVVASVRAELVDSMTGH